LSYTVDRPARPPTELRLMREEFMKEELPPEKLLVESAMLRLNVFVLFKSIPMCPLCGYDDTDIALYNCTNVEVLPVRISWSWNALYLSFVSQCPCCSS